MTRAPETVNECQLQYSSSQGCWPNVVDRAKHGIFVRYSLAPRR